MGHNRRKYGPLESHLCSRHGRPQRRTLHPGQRHMAPWSPGPLPQLGWVNRKSKWHLRLPWILRPSDRREYDWRGRWRLHNRPSRFEDTPLGPDISEVRPDHGIWALLKLACNLVRFTSEGSTMPTVGRAGSIHLHSSSVVTRSL